MDVSYQIASGKGFGPHGIGLTPQGSNGMPVGSCPGVRAPVFLVHHTAPSLAKQREDDSMLEDYLKTPYKDL